MFAVVLLAATVSVKAAPPIRVAVCDPNHFLTKAYQDLLGRPIDAAASAQWLGAMKNGMTRSQVASQMTSSAEYRSALARELYNTYLHRQPSANEVAYFSSMNAAQVEALILGSNEYFMRRGGGTSGGFVNALYEDVLGRAADPQAIAMFGQQQNRGVVAQQVLSSMEARQRAINAVYLKYLRHAAPPSAFNMTHEQAVTTVIGSDEYCRQ
ncbi:MAG TPA: DUF4214 domain-containing protein [Thermoanaerobaculia bacterium]